MLILIIITSISIIISYILNKGKTFEALKNGVVMFIKLFPYMLAVIIIISILLYFISREFLIENFGSNPGITSYFLAAIAGSITLMPGFVAYPVCSYLIQNGVGYPIVAVFITSLMMVGVITIPIEKKYFGIKSALLRNALSFIGALIVGAIMALIWDLI